MEKPPESFCPCPESEQYLLGCCSAKASFLIISVSLRIKVRAKSELAVAIHVVLKRVKRQSTHSSGRGLFMIPGRGSYRMRPKIGSFEQCPRVLGKKLQLIGALAMP
jgi:hypothetical protein